MTALRRTRAVVTAALTILLLGLALAQNNSVYPVVPVPRQCFPSCTQFPAYLESTCVFCLAGAGVVYGFNATYLPPIQRLPFQEFGFTHIPAFVVSGGFTQQILAGLENQRDDTLNSMWANKSSTTARVCQGTQCVTRPMAPTMLLTAEGLLDNSFNTSTPGCIKQQGWLRPVIPPSDYAAPCPGSPALTLQNTKFSQPSSLAGFYPSSRNISMAQPEAVDDAVSFFSSVTAAADSLWRVSQTAHSFLFHFHNVSTQADLDRVMALYEDEWQGFWTSAYRQGNLVELDMTWMEGITSTKWNVVPHALLQYVNDGGSVSLRVMAVRLSNEQADPYAYQVYTLKKSRTAFMQALMAARSAISFSLIYIGHVYHQHVIQSAATYALYNSIDPGVPFGQSSDPIRILADSYFHPYFLGLFNVGLYVGAYPPPIHALIDNDAGPLPTVYEFYATAGPLPGNNSLYETTIEQLLVRSGLSVSKFTSPGGQPWDLYPSARYHLDIKNITNNFAGSFVNLTYPSDAAVASNANVQRFVQQMIDPMGGNLVKISADNQIKTRKQLADLLSHLLSLTVVHIGASTLDFTARQWSAAWMPFCTTMPGLFSPNATYSLPEMVAATIDAYTFTQQVTFNAFFQVAINPTIPQWVPYKCDDKGCPPPYTETAVPDYTGSLPFNNDNPALRRVNDLFVNFRKAVPQYMATTKYCRAISTQLSNPDTLAVMSLNYIIN